MKCLLPLKVVVVLKYHGCSVVLLKLFYKSDYLCNHFVMELLELSSFVICSWEGNSRFSCLHIVCVTVLFRQHKLLHHFSVLPFVVSVLSAFMRLHIAIVFVFHKDS